jgi:uncharacterized membrane protein YobD (UPF0266 family)
VLLAIPLLRRSRVDGLIFVGLIAILIYNNITQIFGVRIQNK